ncbi:MAG: hypothetical protein LBF95_05570 [Treponema sp.]|nr:hypothetical protein [Treponema sp.]
MPPDYPNCLVCVHFKVTWDPAFPRSCGVFGFKSRNLPSVEVFASTGRRCPLFQERPPKKPGTN